MSQNWMDINEAAVHLKMSRSKIQKLTAKRSIPGYKNGGKWLFKAYELDNWVVKGCDKGFQVKQYPDVYQNWKQSQAI